MTEEINQENQKEKCNCICCSEGFRDFLKIALGSFVGVFLALTLFAALHKPPMMPHNFGPHMMCPCMHCHHGMYKKFGGDFHKFKMERRGFDKQIPVKVEIDK